MPVWRRCKKVVLENGVVKWELEQNEYNLFQAYEKAPHRQLINARDDDSLLSFIKTWGPLCHSLPWDLKGDDSIKEYRHEQRKLAWIVRLFASIESSTEESHRSALIDFLDLEEVDEELSLMSYARWPPEVKDRLYPAGFPPRPIFRANSFNGAPEVTAKWIRHADPKELEALCHSLLNRMNSLKCLEFSLEEKDGRYSVRAVTGAGNLIEVLHWMVWQDVFQMNPLRFCAECNKLILNSSRHAKKFCTDECARRKTVREWQKRNRVKGRGKINGT